MNARFSITRGPPLRKATHCSSNNKSTALKNKKKTTNIINSNIQEDSLVHPNENDKNQTSNEKKQSTSTVRASKQINSKDTLSKQKNRPDSFEKPTRESKELKVQNKCNKSKTIQSSQSKIRSKNETNSQTKNALIPANPNNQKYINQKQKSQIISQQKSQINQPIKQKAIPVEKESNESPVDTEQAVTQSCTKNLGPFQENSEEPKISIEELIQTYHKLAQEYKEALENRKQLKDERKQIQDKITNAYTEQCTLETNIMENAKLKFSMTHLFS